MIEAAAAHYETTGRRDLLDVVRGDGSMALAFESKSVGQGAILLFIYSLGLGLPFLAIGLVW